MNSTIRTSLILILSLASSQLFAGSFDRIERRNFWNAGNNVAGLRMDSVTISYAEIYGNAIHGGYRDYSDASQSWKAGAVAKTITHLKKISMKGSFSFDHFSGRQMCGSMFIHPGKYPVDVMEFTPGTKTLQTYSFSGGIAADITDDLVIGASIDYTAANYSKRKDLRHTNYRLDMKIAPGLMYRIGDFTIGAAYVYRKTAESVVAAQIGNAETSYYAFLDKGMMFGAYEIWDGNGTHLAESGINGFPVKEHYHGASVQFQWKRFYADIEYRHGKGFVGEKQSIWFEFPADAIISHMAFGFGRDGNQTIRLRIKWSGLTNNENVLGTETENGITITHKYGSNKIHESSSVSLNPEYERIGEIWETRAGLSLLVSDEMSSLMYPYSFSMNLLQGTAYFENLIHAGKFDLGISAAYFQGRISETETRAEMPPGTEAGEYPQRIGDFYDIWKEYSTAPAFKAGISIRYNFLKGFYAEFSGTWSHGFRLKHIGGNNRWSGTLKLGYEF